MRPIQALRRAVRGYSRRFWSRVAYVRDAKRRNVWGLTEQQVIRLTRERCHDRQQWRRWYKINTKRQRQLRAFRQLGGGRIDPRFASLPRYMVA